MNSEICEKLSVLCLGLFTVATASTAGAGAIVVGGAGALLVLPALWHKYQAWSDCAEKRAVKQAASAALKAYRNSAQRSHDLPEAIGPAEAALATVVDLIRLDPAQLAGAGWDMAALPGLIVDLAASRSSEFALHSPDPQAGHNRALLLFLAAKVVAAMQAQPGFEASVMPAFRRDVVGRLAAIESKQDVHTALLEELLRRIPATEEGRRAETTGVPQATIIALARKVSESIEDLEGALAEIDRAISVAIEVHEDAARGRNFGSELNEIFERLAQLTDEGRLADAAEEADREIARWEDMQTELQARGLALLDAGIRQNILNRDATGAAAKIARKLELEITDPSALFETLRAVWQEWYERGRDKGLNFDLEVSIALARLSQDHAATADQRGAALNDLGTALAILGQRDSGTERLEQAVAAFSAALEERTRDRVPLDWAMTQNNLGAALRILGERDSSTERLEQSVAAFSAALEEWTRDRVPLQWAGTQNNLGLALQTLGQRDNGTARLEQAVEAYGSALEEWTRDRVPLDWAMTQNNLGNVLQTLGQRESGTARLEQAVAAYGSALEERTRDRVPLQWAMTQNNLGNALQTLGQRESGTARLEQAVAAYGLALEEWTRERVPLDWATTQNNLGTALQTLGQRDSGTARLEQAVAAYRAALEERTRERIPFLWAQTRENMSLAFEALFKKTGEQDHRTDALQAVRDALEVYRGAKAEFYVAKAERLLARLQGGSSG